MSSTNRYDYIIAGAGCAGLSLVMHMLNCDPLRDKKILIIDKEKKSTNDRTWCFWETEAGLFEPIVYKQWDHLWFRSGGFSHLLTIAPYQYKLIRGIDFYSHCLDTISKHPNVELITSSIEAVNSSRQSSFVVADGETYEAEYIFNSILFEKPALGKRDHYFLQHFKGWVIETQEPVFNTNEATLMDFTVSQEAGATFVYVMPFTPTIALVEYTLFTKELLATDQYDKALKKYIGEHLKIKDYQVNEEEFGVIPMTSFSFPVYQNNIIYIGTAGGQTKASSGYTFRFIQKHSAAIVEKLIANQKPIIKPPKRFGFYDSTLLSVLSQQSVPAAQIFSTLFKKNKPQQVLRFLDNESSFADELKIISSLPTWPFLKAALQQ